MDEPTSGRVPDLLSAGEWKELIASLRLSPREADFIGCAFYDERDCAIAERLGISEHTVHTHRIRVFRKLGVRTTAQLFAAILSAHLTLRNQERVTTP
jgi:DNA-binding NarL/FixJ family response regulator